jgi:hypothetical protein
MNHFFIVSNVGSGYIGMNGRTPCFDSAKEFATMEDATNACNHCKDLVEAITVVEDRDDLCKIAAKELEEPRNSFLVDLVVTKILHGENRPHFGADWRKFLEACDWQEVLYQCKETYHVAYKAESDGSWEIVDTIKAFTTEEAMQFATSLEKLRQIVVKKFARKPWFLLNHELENVNG